MGKVNRKPLHRPGSKRLNRKTVGEIPKDI